MKKRKTGLIIFFILFFAWIVWMFFFLMIRGKKQDEQTNRPDADLHTMGINRKEEKATAKGSVSQNGVTINYRLPENFYYNDEMSDESGNGKTYYNYNFSVMLDIFLYRTHEEDTAMIDMENPENSRINKGKRMDADAWFEEMQLLYLGRIEDTDIKEMTVRENEVRYFTKYFQNESGQMQGTLIAMITLGEDYYYCIRAVEFGKDKAPSPEEYKNVFYIEIREE